MLPLTMRNPIGGVSPKSMTVPWIDMTPQERIMQMSEVVPLIIAEVMITIVNMKNAEATLEMTAGTTTAIVDMTTATIREMVIAESATIQERDGKTTISNKATHVKAMLAAGIIPAQRMILRETIFVKIESVENRMFQKAHLRCCIVQTDTAHRLTVQKAKLLVTTTTLFSRLAVVLVDGTNLE
jgi:hypothetical protein